MMETYAERLKRETPEEFKKRVARDLTPPGAPRSTITHQGDIDELHPIMEPQIPGPDADKNVENVVKQLRDRAEKGLLKYGVTTERKDLSTIEWLQHLQEELMDATVYIEKLKNQIKEEY